METKRKALGKGLEELFSEGSVNFDTFEEKITKETPKNEILELKLVDLRANPYQPRKTFDEEKLEELAESIKERGVFQPIIVKRSSVKGYEIVAGERRVRASKMAGRKTIPAIIKDFSDQDMMEIALLENLQREDLNAIEEATAYKGLLESLHITQEELAKRLGKSRSYITNMLGLLNLDNNVKDKIINGEISAGHGRVLSKLDDSKEVKKLLKETLDNSLTVRSLEDLVRNKSFNKKRKTEIKEKSSSYYHLEEKISDTLGTKVKINNKKMEIYFTNEFDLDRILDIMNIKEDD